MSESCLFVRADYLLSRTSAASECIEKLQDAHSKYLANRTGEAGLGCVGGAAPV